MTIKTPLARKATLVSLSISKWSGRKLDKTITADIAAQHGTDVADVRATKALFKKEDLDAINKAASRVSVVWRGYTRPWSDDGVRVLPNLLYSKAMADIGAAIREFDGVVGNTDFAAIIARRQGELKGIFNPDDYPTPDEIKASFGIRVNVMPFPDASDFRADIDADTLADIRAEVAAADKRVTDGMRKQTLADIVQTVGHMATKLREYKASDQPKPGDNGGPSTRMHDSMVGNVRRLAELLPAFNMEGDPALTALTQRIEAELCVETPKALKASATLRKSVAQSADDILAEVSKLIA